MDRETIVKELLAEMKFRLLNSTPDTRRDDDAAIMLFSNVLKALTAEPAMPSIEQQRRAA